MKRWSELTEPQQSKALTIIEGIILEGLISGQHILIDSELQAKVDNAIEKSEQMQTPWFAGEYVWDVLSEEIKEMAREDSSQYLFLNDYEGVIRERELNK
jgi:hypothetical protein